MDMSVRCKDCNGEVAIKLDKVLLAVGGAAVMAPLAAAFGLKAGLISLATAALQGRPHAAKLLELKARLMVASSKMGSFFYCKDCKNDVSVTHVFNQLL